MKRPIPNPNHPKPGQSIKVEPIRCEKAVRAIKKMLAGSPRDLTIFTLGINSALRAGDLLGLTVGQVRGLKIGDSFQVKEQKTGRHRWVTLNKVSHKAVMDYLATRDGMEDDDPLFASRKAGAPLRVVTLHALVKGWCRDVNLPGNYGSHSLRKTFGYHQRVRFGMGTAILMKIFNHRSEKQTLDYLGIHPEEELSVQLNEI